MNFLGLAAFLAGDGRTAGNHWAKSAELGDWSAPLLLARLHAHRSE
jgi:hypothetical protein